ncbi:hypothetical protein V6N13_029163 [Hibiscus sabdariffa]
MIAVAAALWSIWLMRNEKIYDNKYAIVKDLLFNTKMRALVWVNASKTSSIENVAAWWESPSTSFLWLVGALLIGLPCGKVMADSLPMFGLCRAVSAED